METVARYICERSGWSVSNLQLQKIMYLAQMIYMGRNKGRLLFEGDFEAWDYGPVLPDLYRLVKVFGSNSVKDVFARAKRFAADDKRVEFLDEICEKFLHFTAGQLVSITHSPKGAWYCSYRPNLKGVKIAAERMLEEYSRRTTLVTQAF